MNIVLQDRVCAGVGAERDGWHHPEGHLMLHIPFTKITLVHMRKG